MGFLKQRKKQSFARMVIGGGPLSGKSTLAVEMSKSDHFGPLAYIDVEGSARFYKDQLAPGSEYVDMQDLIEGKDIVKQLTKLGDKGGGTFPFKSVVIDTWYSLFKRFTKTYDETKTGDKVLKVEADLYSEKRKNMQAWGDVKSPFTKMLLDILYLPANIIWLTWQKQDMNKYGVPLDGKFTPRYDGFTEHMSDVILRLDDRRKFQVFRDRSGTIKNGDPVSVATLEKVMICLNGEGFKDDPKSVTQETIKPSGQTPSDALICESCGATVSAVIAKATAAQSGGKVLCPKCLKKA